MRTPTTTPKSTRPPCYPDGMKNLFCKQWNQKFAANPFLPAAFKTAIHTQDPVAFATHRLGIQPDPQQAAFLASTANHGILNCTRQWGKSTMAAIKAVHRAYTRPDSLVVVASPSERQSAEFVRKASSMVHRLGLKVKTDGTGDPSILLPNGSRLVGLPGNEETIRGLSAVSLLLIDEASRLEDRVYLALRPMLAVSGGDLWLMSTPCGRRGFFYEAWELGGETWERHRVPATECPRISPEFLEHERSQMSPMWFRQEFMAEFVDNGTAVFGRDIVEAAFEDAVQTADLLLDLGPHSRQRNR